MSKTLASMTKLDILDNCKDALDESQKEIEGLRSDYELVLRQRDNMTEGYNVLQEQKAEMQAEIARLRAELAALKYTIVATVGGVDYEGFPTSEINYLQRLRILLEKEADNKRLRDGLREITDRLQNDVDNCCGENIDHFCENYGCAYINKIINELAKLVEGRE